MKDAWYDGGAGGHRNLADARAKAEHLAKRRMLAHIFAQKTIANPEPVVTETITVLVAQVDKYSAAGNDINIRHYLNYFTIDLFAELLYGNSFGCLERGDDIVSVETRDDKICEAPFTKSLHNSTVMGTVLGMEAPMLPVTKKCLAWHSYKVSGADYKNIIYHSTKKWLRDPDAEDDIFFKLLKNDKR